MTERTPGASVEPINTLERVGAFSNRWIRGTAAAIQPMPRLIRWIVWLYSLALLVAALPYATVALSPLDRRAKAMAFVALTGALIALVALNSPARRATLEPAAGKGPSSSLVETSSPPLSPVASATASDGQTGTPLTSPATSATPAPVAFQVVEVRQFDSRGRARWALRVVIGDAVEKDKVIATLAAIMRSQSRPHVTVVYAYRSASEMDGLPTVGRAWLSTDGLGWAGDGQFIDGADTKLIVGNVVTRLDSTGTPAAEEKFVAPR